MHSNRNSFKPSAITLPAPTLARSRLPISSNYPPDFELLDHLMTLSLAPWALGGSMWSIFWEPGVPCLFAGAWTGPIVSVLEPIIQADDLELLAKILSFSKLAPFWLGVALCGRKTVVRSIPSSLRELHDYPHTLPHLNGAAWTGTRQSFMDAPQLGLTGPPESVSRADVWRLRHDCHGEYPYDEFWKTPRYGWPPFGTMRVADVELEIRQHVACTHVWRYDYWTWTLGGKDSGFDPHGENGSGLSSPSPEATEENDSVVDDIDIIHQACTRATRAVFWWSSTQVEEGFGGDIVPRWGCGRNEAVKSAERVHRVDYDRIRNWLASVAQESAPNVLL